jgi:AraC family transcriptional regulator, melibiose operon regulatory protein
MTGSILRQSARFNLDPDPDMPFPEILHEFDEARPALSPYGLTCVRWRATPMGRADRHNEIELNWLPSGSITYLLAGRRITVAPRRLAAFWAVAPHRIVAREEPSPYFVATIPLNLILQWKLPAVFLNRILGGDLLQENAESPRLQDALLFDQWIDDLQDGSPERVEIALLQLHARLRRMALSCSAPDDDRSAGSARPLDQESSSNVEKMAMYIARNYRRRLRVAEVGDAVGLHPDYAAALFRRTFGTTIGRFLLDHRVAHAQRLLSTTTRKVTEIAFESGFESVSRFNAAFKAVSGCTPREYRASQNPGA